jgi:opacity protein-like surface antigen
MTDAPLNRSSSSSNGLGYSFAAGDGLENVPVRFELEAASQQNVNYNSNYLFGGNDGTQQNFSSKVSSYHVMANVLFDFHLNSYIMPYVKVGAGIASNQSKLSDTFPSSDPDTFGQPLTENVTTTNTNLAWQAGLGSAVRLDDNLYINGELRYLDLGKVTWKNFYNAQPQSGGLPALSLESKEFSSYQASVGLLWFFGGTRFTAPAPKMA